jgi:hypothetical protein
MGPPPPPLPNLVHPPDITTHQELTDELRKAWDSLTEGRFVYPISLDLKQGVSQIVSVRVTSTPTIDTSEFQGDVVVAEILTSASMSAHLNGDHAIFLIEPMSSERQALAGDHVDWRWRVTALAQGSHQLHLRVTAHLWLSNGSLEPKDILTYNTPVLVKVNTPYLFKEFMKRYWMWLAGLLIGSPVAIGIVSRLKSRLSSRKKFIGFK